ncbi:E3 ubiquitin- ligase Zswim2-like [Brachionus plicatilis]|uniref:E3 ubiquitin-ligase Zswim2-like n=1 Tax=Brachionus plicatilis TaxID=10195 RepID=A0A3M7PD85_BRAPC|nr:E3 ubiquitin- ligase Zswim2-like [Brachionus plicatilis]
MIKNFQNCLFYDTRPTFRDNKLQKFISQIDPIAKCHYEDICLSDLSLSISPPSSACPEEKKPQKWTNVTQQLALFTAKKTELPVEPDESPRTSSASDSPSDYELEFVAKRKKRTKLKKLIKSNQLKSAKNASVLLNSDLDRKKNCKYLYLRHNLYKKAFVDYYFSHYVAKLDRARHLYAKNTSKSLDHNFLIENKKMFKNLNLVEKIIHKSSKESRVKHFVVDFDQVDQELEQNIDEVYLNFLIQLQHREITPEDYEHLTRLDEFVRKKCLPDKILQNLKTEPVDDWMTGEKCGICYEEYEFGQLCKYLPCGHMFHSDCVDSWLRQSVNCPMDNLSVEEVWHQMLDIEKSVKDVLRDLVTEIERDNR